MPCKAVIKRERRIFDDFFQIDEIVVSHEQADGTMSADTRQLVFERGDAVAVLLLNIDREAVVLVEQFKVPSLVGRRRDDPSTSNGWILETVAGMINQKETPEAAAIRETMEETGYRIHHPRLISQFFSSPGGTSERIFLYFAEVRDSDKQAEGGGIDGEHITVVHMSLEDLFSRLARGAVDDPKLLIAAYWLQDQVSAGNNRKRHIEAFWDRTTSARAPAPAPVMPTTPANQPLSLSTVRYAVNGQKGCFVGYKTGAIDRIKDVALWANSENTDMTMDRFLGRSVSASIRYLGANKDEHGNVVEDTIEEALRNAVGRRGYVKIGTVLVTESGALRATHNVMRILHVATVEGVAAGLGVKADASRLAHCVDNLLKRADEENNRPSRRWLIGKHFESILIPTFGTGDGGLSVEDVPQTIIPPAIEYFQYNKAPTLKEIYFLAYTERARDAFDRALQLYLTNKILVPA
jgi:nudix-type nucleoside diphosphatase (YffH/AdpP family)